LDAAEFDVCVLFRIVAFDRRRVGAALVGKLVAATTPRAERRTEGEDFGAIARLKAEGRLQWEQIRHAYAQYGKRQRPDDRLLEHRAEGAATHALDALAERLVLFGVQV
jgi:hypothetical protein